MVQAAKCKVDDMCRPLEYGLAILLEFQKPGAEMLKTIQCGSNTRSLLAYMYTHTHMPMCILNTNLIYKSGTLNTLVQGVKDLQGELLAILLAGGILVFQKHDNPSSGSWFPSTWILCQHLFQPPFRFLIWQHFLLPKTYFTPTPSSRISSFERISLHKTAFMKQ